MDENLETQVLKTEYNIKGYLGETKEDPKSNTTSQEKYLTEGYLRIPSESLK